MLSFPEMQVDFVVLVVVAAAGDAVVARLVAFVVAAVVVPFGSACSDAVREQHSSRNRADPSSVPSVPCRLSCAGVPAAFACLTASHEAALCDRAVGQVAVAAGPAAVAARHAVGRRVALDQGPFDSSFADLDVEPSYPSDVVPVIDVLAANAAVSWGVK